MADNRRRLSEAEQNQIIEMYLSRGDDGEYTYSLRDIEDAVRVSRAGIFGLLDRKGIPRRSTPAPTARRRDVAQRTFPVELSDLPPEVWDRVADRIVPYLFDELLRLRLENERLRAQLGEA